VAQRWGRSLEDRQWSYLLSGRRPVWSLKYPNRFHDSWFEVNRFFLPMFKALMRARLPGNKLERRDHKPRRVSKKHPLGRPTGG
jgi:hypothetical protein